MNYEMLDRNKLNESFTPSNPSKTNQSHLIVILHRAQGLFGLSAKGIADLCS